MGWSLALGKFGETTVRLHWSFLLFLFWIGVMAFLREGAGAAIGGIVFLTLLFFCVVLHEFGHILAARHFGVKTPEVLLLPIGGVSRLERFPEEPRQELVIALAGPVVSLAIGLGLLLLFGFPAFSPDAAEGGIAQVLGQLGWINLFLAVFNLLPAFPMDGGRVLRALLAARLGYARGTRIAAGAGQIAAAVFGFLGLLSGNVILIFIALFVFLAAGGEAGLAQMRNATLGLTAADVMITDFESLRVEEPVSAAADALIRTSQREFPVIDSAGLLQGVLARDDIIKALHQNPAMPAREAMQADVPVVSARHSADALVRLLQQGAPMVVVADPAGRPVGFVTWENMLEHVMIQNARAKTQAVSEGNIRRTSV
ncbi:protease [Croceicoccus estronivorus]|nr:protease [Croceicoccus estronivorus]